MLEWKKLGEVCSFNRGKTITAKDACDGDVPVIAGGQTPSYFHNESNRTGESITVAGSGAYAGFVSYWNQPIFVSDAFTVDPKGPMLHKYIFHWLKMNQQRIFATQKGAGVPHVHGKDIANFEIPVPSITEQTRIVGILDTFTASIENLKQQIAQRRKQYEHYRDQLLDLEGKEGVEIKTIGEVCKTITPPKKLATKNYQLQGLFPIIDQGQSVIVGYTDDESALVPNGEYVLFGDHTRFVKFYKGRFAQGADGLKILKVKDFVSSRYFYFAFSNAEVPSRGYSRHWSIAKELPIPVPSITEQQHIVSILDTFEASIANLEQQLAQRERQYEYYRNKLLTFE